MAEKPDQASLGWVLPTRADLSSWNNQPHCSRLCVASDPLLIGVVVVVGGRSVMSAALHLHTEGDGGGDHTKATVTQRAQRGG